MEHEFQDQYELERALTLMESSAFNFAYRFIQDSKVRESYIKQTQNLTKEYRHRVNSGQIAAVDAAKQVQSLRNEILEAQRLRSSDIGKSKAVSLKQTGLTFDELTNKYAEKKYGKSLNALSAAQKNQVYLEIVESAGRTRPSANAMAKKYSILGRSLLVVTIGVAVYNVTTADDKVKATAKEGAVIGGGIAGGAAGGAIAGLACGPGAPVCVTIGVFIGGALGALGADLSFGWIF